MNTKINRSRQLLSMLLAFSVTAVPVLASDDQKPLKEKENPQLIRPYSDD